MTQTSIYQAHSVTFPAARYHHHWPAANYTTWLQRHMCLNNLPRRWNSQQLNLSLPLSIITNFTIHLAFTRCVLNLQALKLSRSRNRESITDHTQLRQKLHYLVQVGHLLVFNEDIFRRERSSAKKTRQLVPVDQFLDRDCGIIAIGIGRCELQRQISH